jgi:hypothetical protein
MPCTPAATRATVKSFPSGILAPAYEQEQRGQKDTAPLWNRCQTEVLKVALYCCVKSASQRRIFAIICYKSRVDRCDDMRVGCYLDLHELAFSRTF